MQRGIWSHGHGEGGREGWWESNDEVADATANDNDNEWWRRWNIIQKEHHDDDEEEEEEQQEPRPKAKAGSAVGWAYWELVSIIDVDNEEDAAVQYQRMISCSGNWKSWQRTWDMRSCRSGRSNILLGWWGGAEQEHWHKEERRSSASSGILTQGGVQELSKLVLGSSRLQFAISMFFSISCSQWGGV
jgi:hypothetical protein